LQTLEYEASAKIVAARPKPFPAFRPGDVLNLKLVRSSLRASAALAFNA
jgi:hypothetical protein